MQSNGFLAEKINFNGKMLSFRPAGGVIGGIEVAKKIKLEKLLGLIWVAPRRYMAL